MAIRADQIGFSVASLANYDLFAAIEKGRELGFGALELLAFDGARHSIGLLRGFWFDRMSDGERRRLAAAVGGFAFVSTHAPFIAIQPFTHNPGIREESLRQLHTAVDATGYLHGCECTVHINSQSYLTIRDYWEEVVAVLRQLGDHAAECSVRIGVETGYPNTVEDYCRLIEAVDHKNVGACIDVGHITLYCPPGLRGKPEGIAVYNDLLMQIVRRLRDKLFSFHLHDVRLADFRDHRAVGRGIINYRQLLSYLSDAGYGGPLLMELEETDIEAALSESKRHVESALQARTK